MAQSIGNQKHTLEQKLSSQYFETYCDELNYNEAIAEHILCSLSSMNHKISALKVWPNRILKVNAMISVHESLNGFINKVKSFTLAEISKGNKFLNLITKSRYQLEQTWNLKKKHEKMNRKRVKELESSIQQIEKQIEGLNMEDMMQTKKLLQQRITAKYLKGQKLTYNKKNTPNRKQRLNLTREMAQALFTQLSSIESQKKQFQDQTGILLRKNIENCNKISEEIKKIQTEQVLTTFKKDDQSDNSQKVKCYVEEFEEEYIEDVSEMYIRNEVQMQNPKVLFHKRNFENYYVKMQKQNVNEVFQSEGQQCIEIND